jgi:hypothetical protein
MLYLIPPLILVAFICLEIYLQHLNRRNYDE